MPRQIRIGTQKITINRGVVVTPKGYVLLRMGPYLKKPLYIGKATDPQVFVQAEEKRLRVLLDMRTNKLDLSPTAREASIEQGCDAFMQLHGNKIASKGLYKAVFERICADWSGRTLSSITFKDVEAYCEDRILEGMAEASVNREHRCITALFHALKRWVARKEVHPIILPETNPSSLVPLFSEEDYVRTRVLSREEYDRLLHCSTSRVKAIIQAAVYSLLRLKDLKHISGGRLNDEAQIYSLTQAKTGKTVWFNIDQQDYRAILGSLDFTNFRKEFQAGVAKSHIENFTFRDLRRTGATWLYKETGDKKLVSDRLGHTTVAMTEKYLGIQSEDRTRASSIMKSLVFRAEETVQPSVINRSYLATIAPQEHVDK